VLQQQRAKLGTPLQDIAAGAQLRWQTAHRTA
jgi:hypothetical protein